MTDPAGLIALGTSAPLALKVLGPTADYLGDGLQSWAERRVQNVRRIFEIAGRRLGDENLSRDGTISPRILKAVLDEGSYWDDELGAEYFGGILASSRNEIGRDDRGATLAALVGRLSTYQLRCHYVLYSGAQRLLQGTGQNLGWAHQRSKKGRFFITERAWLADMDCPDDERLIGAELMSHSVTGLIREELLGEKYGVAGPQGLQDGLGDYAYPAPGIVFEVSILGIELFTVAHGVADSSLATFVSDYDFSVDSQVQMSGGVARVEDLPALKD